MPPLPLSPAFSLYSRNLSVAVAVPALCSYNSGNVFVFILTSCKQCACLIWMCVVCKNMQYIALPCDGYHATILVLAVVQPSRTNSIFSTVPQV